MGRLREDGRVQLAAAMGRFFRIDPLAVLKSDYFEWAVRRAAFELAVEAHARAMDKANKPTK